MMANTRNDVSGRRLQGLRQELKLEEADMSKLRRKIHCLNIQHTLLAIDIKIRDCKTTAQAVLRRVIIALKDGTSCGTHDQRPASPTEEAALLHEHTYPSKRYETQVEPPVDSKRSKLAQLAHKQDHYTSVLSRMKEESKATKLEIARYCATGSHHKTMPPTTARAGSALLQSSIRNGMSPSAIIVLYEDVMERSRGSGGCGSKEGL
ncbi:hypothetical protein E2P81_ATG00501 [Venturia nashicola]|uniref:Uncharacterized protein n=1 Tax=Venturia nashicola TaxID=86259 RepID=A0A4Z1PIL3_9PEZI|nr:hypothetical protein E6O75_ATG00514 [Venturia nashicola]TLD39514.1 hypothetical protein E2P81_ATG00501 [Venturia nashicola]